MDIQGAELFAVGKWNEIEFTEADLDAMVESFQALALAGRVPLKLGHNQEQPFTDGQPALGWVSRVWRDGKKLFGDFTAMPRVVYDAVKQGIYKFVSVELLRESEYDGSKYPWVLSAVALLGADIPAVSGLKDLQTLAMSRRAALRSGVALTFTRDVSTSGGRKTMADEKDTPDLAKVMEQVNALSAQVATFTTENATLKADNERLKKEAKDREDALRKEKITAHRAAIGAKFDDAIKQKIIIPSVRHLFEKNPAFTSDDGVLGITLDFVDGYIKDHKVAGAKPAPRDGGNDNVSDDTDDTTPPDVRVTKLTFARIEKSGGKLSYYDAQRMVLRDDPKLAEAYRLQPGVFDSRGGKAT